MELIRWCQGSQPEPRDAVGPRRHRVLNAYQYGSQTTISRGGCDRHSLYHLCAAKGMETRLTCRCPPAGEQESSFATTAPSSVDAYCRHHYWWCWVWHWFCRCCCCSCCFCGDGRGGGGVGAGAACISVCGVAWQGGGPMSVAKAAAAGGGCLPTHHPSYTRVVPRRSCDALSTCAACSWLQESAVKEAEKRRAAREVRVCCVTCTRRGLVSSAHGTPCGTVHCCQAHPQLSGGIAVVRQWR